MHLDLVYLQKLVTYFEIVFCRLFDIEVHGPASLGVGATPIAMHSAAGFNIGEVCTILVSLLVKTLFVQYKQLHL